MSEFDAVSIVQKAIVTTLVVTSPILVVSLLVAIVSGFFQAATQIQDQSLSFIPKLLAILILIATLLPWFLDQLVAYSWEMFSQPLGF